MTDNPAIDAIAQRAATRLADDLDPHLPDRVAEVLANDKLAVPAQRVFDPISLAALLVSAASLGWTIHRDMKQDRTAVKHDAATTADGIAAQLTGDADLSARQPPGLTQPQRALLIKVVAAEIVATGEQ